MSVAFRYAARSNIGLGRYKNNQDSGFAGPHILAVCDGMGGHAGGDIASSVAVGYLATLDGESLGSDAPQKLVATIRKAHAEMLRRVEDSPQLAGLGTTVTSLLKFGNKLALAHIGDSRAYCCYQGTTTQITKDHTFVQWLIDQGSITEEEAEVHPQRSVITRVLGDADASDKIDTSVREARLGERWMLCSDGLSGPISDETISATLQSVEDPAECAEKLIDLALKGGGQDNITCVVADVVSADTEITARPSVVGAASVISSNAPTTSTPATRAADITRPKDDDAEKDDTPAPRRNLKPALMAIVALLSVAVISAGLYGGYKWTQDQYYVGLDDDYVAIYRGLTDDIGPLSMSSVEERTEIPTEALNESTINNLTVGISVSDKQGADDSVLAILRSSRLCVPVNEANGEETDLSDTEEPTPTATDAPGQPGDAQAPQESTANAAAPTTETAATPVEPGSENDLTLDPQATPSAVVTTATEPTTPTQTPQASAPQINYLGEPLPTECERQ